MNILSKAIHKYSSMKYHVVVTGAVIGIVFWILDSSIHSLVLHKGVLSQEYLLLHNRNELLMRALLLAIFLLFSTFIQIAINRRKKAETLLMESQSRLAEIQHLAHMGNWDWDITTNELWCSQEASRILGLAPESSDLTFESFIDIVHPDDRANFSSTIQDALENNTHFSIEHRIVMRDNSDMTVSEQADIIFDETGVPVRIIATVQEITKRIHVDLILRNVAEKVSIKTGEEYFMSLVEFISKELGTEYTLVGKYNQKNNTVDTIALYAHGSIIENMTYDLEGTPCENVIGKEPCVYHNNIQHMFPQDTLLVDMKAVSYAAVPLFGSNGQTLGLVATLGCRPMNIHPDNELISILQIFSARAAAELARKKAEEELGKFKFLSDNASDAHLLVNENAVPVYVNKAACRMFGYTKSELLSLSLTDIDTVLDIDKFNDLFRLIHKGASQPFETSAIKKDGTSLSAEVTITGCQLNDTAYMFIAFRDVSERKLVEQALIESEERFKGIVDNIGIGVALLTPDMRILLVNTKMREWFPEIDISETPECRTALESFKDAGICANCPTLKTLKDGNVHEIVVNALLNKKEKNFKITSSPIKNSKGEIISTIEMYEDITEQKKIEEQLLQSQKMESIGTLAGGVAHDFNNIITAIIGFASVINRRMDDNDPSKQFIEQIQTAAENAASLTSRLLTFSRKQQINPVAARLNEIITNVEKLLYRIIGEDIDFRTVLADEDMYIMADSNQLEQVFINLIGNSRDAMPKGGELVLTTGPVFIADDFIRTHGFGKPGSYAMISVSDSGTGMDDATREKIFEPFFTTKDVDKGTGLGLSIIYGIIKQHNGYIDVQTSPGEGTIFKIYLPIVNTPAYTISEVRQTDSLPVRGTETILVAEDNEMILKLITTVLTEYGYNVITACDGEDALNKYIESKDSIDLVISDLVMPKKSGRDLHNEIKILDPDIKILFLSGYSEELMHREDIIEQDINLMSKPVNTNDLLKKIRGLLGTECIH